MAQNTIYVVQSGPDAYQIWPVVAAFSNESAAMDYVRDEHPDLSQAEFNEEWTDWERAGGIIKSIGVTGGYRITTTELDPGNRP